MTPSETIQETGGISGDWLSLERRAVKGGKQVLRVDSHRVGMSCVASTSDSGRPSGMVSKRKEGRPFRESGPRDFRRRLWLKSVFTKVM